MNAAGLDVPLLMSRLASSRPVFHSEADFQHALAWLIHSQHPSAAVRLEMPIPEIGPSIHVDVFVTNNAHHVAIELKYKTRFLAAEIDGEGYRLTTQSAVDCGRYDFWLDVSRLERFTENRSSSIGYAIFLTNESAYWKPARRLTSVDAAFRVSDGLTVGGSLAWDPRASDGTRHNREAPIELKCQYQVSWREYSNLANVSGGEFRYLFVEVKAPAALPGEMR